MQPVEVKPLNVVRCRILDATSVQHGGSMRTITIIATLTVLLSCAVHAQDAPKTVIASDKKTQITVPSTWGVLQLNDAAELQVGNAKDEAYLIVLNEAKDDLYGWNLEKHSRVTLGNLLGKVAFPVVSGPKSLTIGGRPALQYEIRGASKNRNIVYIHTSVDGVKHFSQILAWTLPSHAETALPQLLQAITTFQEIQ